MGRTKKSAAPPSASQAKTEAGRGAGNEAGKKIRLDKWLWAARFYKTRGIAKQAIDGGKVSCDGQKSRPAKEIALGAKVTLRQGWDEKTVVVKELSDQRRGAPEATRLYEETPESIEQRRLEAERRKAQAVFLQPQGKPDKKDRRLRQALKHRGE